MNWIRVTKTNLCPQCQKSTWCLLSKDGKACLCMRVVSDRPKTLSDQSMGWVHFLDRPIQLPNNGNSWKPPPDPPTINCRQLIDAWIKTTDPERVLDMSQQLKVSVRSLRALQVCWAPEHYAWAIPMSDAYGHFVGIRLRSEGGQKWAVRGSHQGCFIPIDEPRPMALVCEGFSDTAAGLDLGFYAVGRPCASGGIDQLKYFFRRVGVRKAAVVCDNDSVGITGAKMFSEHLGIPSCLIVLPCKDLREFVQCGGNAQLMNTYLNSSIWKG